MDGTATFKPKSPLIGCLALVVLGISLGQILSPQDSRSGASGITASQDVSAFFCPISFLLAGHLLSLGVWRWSQTQGLRSWLHGAFATALVCGFASLCMHSRSYFPANDLGCWANEDPSPVCLECRLLAPVEFAPAPEFDPMRVIPGEPVVYFRLAAERLRVGDAWQPVSGSLVAAAAGTAHGAQVGDRLLLWGHLSRPRPPLNPGEFDYRPLARQRRQTTLLRCEAAECVLVLGSSWSGLGIPTAQSWVHETLRNHVSERNFGLATALFLGNRRELEEERRTALLETGVLHLVAISGTHLVFLAWLLFASLRLAPASQPLRCIAVASVCGVYALIAGNEPPVTRAALIVILACLAELQHRKWMGMHVLAAAAVVVLSVNPQMAFNAGAQLSFLAVAVLIHCAPWFALKTPEDPLDRLLLATRPWGQRMMSQFFQATKAAFLTSFAVWIVTTPLSWNLFHLATPFSVVLTPLLSIPTAIALTAGFALLLGGGLFHPLSAALGATIDLSLDILMRVVETAHAVPGALWWSRGPANWHLLGLYSIFLYAILAPPGDVNGVRRRNVCLRVATLFWVLIGVLFDRAPPLKPGELRVTTLSVGHGLAQLVELPDGQCWLYDAGSMTTPNATARRIAGALWSRDITRLHAVVISHADADHYNAIPELARMISIDQVQTTWNALESEGSMRKIRTELQQRGIPITILRSGDTPWRGAHGEIFVSHPAAGRTFVSDNAASVVMEILWQGRRVLLCGDLEEQGMHSWLKQSRGSFDVVQAPHHGSPASRPATFYAALRPLYVIVSGDKRHGAPVMPVPSANKSAAIAEAGAKGAAGGQPRGSASRGKSLASTPRAPYKTFHTAYDGAITVRIVDGQVQVSTFLSGDATGH